MDHHTAAGVVEVDEIGRWQKLERPFVFGSENDLGNAMERTDSLFSGVCGENVAGSFVTGCSLCLLIDPIVD